MSSINFDNAYLLLIAIPLIVLFTVPFVLAIRKENRNKHNIASQIMHVVMAIIIAFAAAGTNITTVLTETDVYVVADVSYSSHKNLDTIDNYIRNLQLPSNTKVGVVCFGKNYELLCDLCKPEEVVSVKESKVDDSETNIAPALAYAGTLFKDDVIKRIVLITDGKQTDESDDYAVRRAVDALEMRDIKVDAIYLDNNVSGDIKEIQVSEANFKASAFINHNETVNVTIQATYATKATISLLRNDQSMGERVVDLAVGSNTVSLDLYTAESGTYDYKVVVAAEGDESQFNNSYSFTQMVSSDVRILVISGSWDNVVSVVDQYKDSATIDVYESSTVNASIKNEYIETLGDNVTINIANKNMPYTMEALSIYDEFILADVDITTFNQFNVFVANLNKVVSDLGKSLVTIGDMHIQDSTSATDKKEARTTLDDMLPVRFGKSLDTPKLYTMVVDISRSMDKNKHLESAKEIARGIIDVLNDNDEVCIVNFYGDVQVFQPPTSLYSRDSLLAAIDELGTKQGTVIGQGLEMAYNLIKGLNYSMKQVMLITDGINFDSGSDNPIDIAARMHEDGIITSVVDIGRQGVEDAVDDRAEALLKGIAATNIDEGSEDNIGRYYYALSRGGVTASSIVKNETLDRVFDKVVTESSEVKISLRTDDVLAGMDVTGLPNVGGYVYSAPKSDAITVLEVNYAKSVKPKQVPLYSYRTQGKGNVASFTTSFFHSTANWLSEWGDELKATFFKNVFERNLPEQKTEQPYTMDVVQDGSSTHVQITPIALHFGTTAKISLTLPDGSVESQNMTFESYYYSFDFPSSGVGKYAIEVTYTYADIDYTAKAAVNVSYTSEYNAFNTFEPSMIIKAIAGRGTVSLDGTLKLENDDHEVGTYRVDLTMPLLIVCVVLFIVDIAVRKLKWEDIKSFFGGFKKSSDKESGGKKQ